jgi:hypothetical protein
MFYPFSNGQLDIVRDGLVLWLDAGDRTSYPGGGTTWRDLSLGGNNGTLNNGPTFDASNGGSIVFDGVDDFAPLGGETPVSLRGNVPFTVEGWFKRSGNWTQGATWGIGGDNTLNGINSWNNNNTNEITIDLWGTSTYTTGQTYSDVIWKHCVWVYLGSSFTRENIIIYINNFPYTSAGLTIIRGGAGTPNINSNGLVLSRAGRNTNLYYGKPIISNFRIYNRALSANEVLQNFNATRGRFGI